MDGEGKVNRKFRRDDGSVCCSGAFLMTLSWAITAFAAPKVSRAQMANALPRQVSLGRDRAFRKDIKFTSIHKYDELDRIAVTCVTMLDH